MRTMQGRGDWRPGSRIEGLLRYAFIGDSTAYGAGVAPDQTLPAHTERQMNELVPGWPVEAVNHGVSGYNLWNSWLAFKHGAQVYDGVVLVLCDNDAELFSRSYPFVYPKPHDPQWEIAHPFGEAVARCFDDIASFSREQALPVIVLFFNMWKYRVRIGEIIGDLCAARDLRYVDTFPLLRDRNFPPEAMVVNKADAHPSALAHEAVGRHLAMTLKRQGWFERYEAANVGEVPERIVSVAKSLVRIDHYPPDAALNWALGALDSKSRFARRLLASGGADDFSAPAGRTKELLTVASLRWHMAQRLRAFLVGVAARGHGIVSCLHSGEEERLKLEELCFALGTGDWDRLAELSFDAGAPQQLVAGLAPSEALTFMEDCKADLRLVGKAIDSLRALVVPAVIETTHDKSLLLADLKILLRHAERVQGECAELAAAFQRMEDACNAAFPALSEARIAQVSGLIGAAIQRAKYSFGFIKKWPAVLDGLRDEKYALFSTVEVTLATEPMADKPFCLLTAEIEYTAPIRLPFSNNGVFLSDGLPMLVRLYLPLFYSGRLLLRTSFMRAPRLPSVEIKLIKVELYNREHQRRTVDLSSFYRDANGRFISPILFLQ